MVPCYLLESDSIAPQALQLPFELDLITFIGDVEQLARLSSTSTMTAASSKPSETQSTLALPELNQRSCGLGAWDVACFNPYLQEYTFTAKNTSQQKNGADFRITFVSTSDPSQYVTAHLSMKAENMSPLQQAKEKFKPNLKFRLSKVGLEASAKQQFLHTPIKQKIDLGRTKAEALMQQKQGEIVQPCPSMTIKDCKKLQQTQRFDVTAILDTVTEVRSVNSTRQVISIIIIDDSADQGKPTQLTFSFFMNVPLSKEDTATMAILQEAKKAEVKQVFTFFALQGTHKDSGYSFEADSKKDFFFVKAVGSRAEHLTQVAEALQKVPEAERDVLQQTSYENRDYENEPGSQILCKLLSDMVAKTDVANLNEKSTLWQANWVAIGWPQGETLLKKDGKSLWFQCTLTDLSGQVVNAWMNEKSALMLSGLADKDAFIESFNQGNQIFPIMATVKVIRELRAPPDAGGVLQPADSKPAQGFVNLVIVHGADQPWNEPPTKAALELIPMLRDLKDDTSAILPAALHMVETSPHYAFTIDCKSASDGSQISIPCQKVLALIRSTKNAKATNLGDGFKLITPGVEDLLSTVDPTGLAGQMKHTLSAICTLSNLPQYRLDPPRGGHQDAPVIVTA